MARYQTQDRRERTVDDLRLSFARREQAHVFAHWDSLDAPARERLLRQVERLEPDLDELIRAREAALLRAAAGSDGPAPEPPDVIPVPATDAARKRAEQARKRGEAVLAAGGVAVLVVAGGQGTRLGFPHPKGCLEIGPITGRTLFELQAQKIRGLRRRSGSAIPWYVMTSAATDSETRAAFADNDYFGLDPADVEIFQQDMVPAFDFEGRLLLEAPDRIFESPGGHGGALTALDASGALEEMDRRGIETIFFYQVDNPLVKIGDPEFVGHHAESGAQMSCKVVRKSDPLEAVGVVARVAGKTAVVEYTELGDEQRYARDAEGRLRFWAGNIAIHLFEVDFVKRVSGNSGELLPFHVSEKQVPTIDSAGRPVEVEAPNAHKLERFVFDALPAAETTCIVEVETQEEFSPIKNATGAQSPDSARRDLVSQYRRWLGDAGLALPPDVELIEIDHAVIDSADDLSAAGIRSLAEARNAIRTAGGRDA